MAPSKHSVDTQRTPDSEIDFAGYDPYIVALTGRDCASTANAGSPEQSTESRKVQLVSWLREHSV